MELSRRLQELECPFNWNLEEVLVLRKGDFRDFLLQKLRYDDYLEDMETGSQEYDDKLSTPVDEKRNHNGSSAWQKCSQFLTMVWLQEHLGLGGEDFLVEMEDFVNDVKNKVPFIERYSTVLDYFIKAMKAHVYFKKDIEKARQCLEAISTFENFGDTDKAALKSLKSCVFMEFGPAGHNGALRAINEVLGLESETAEWHYLKGKCIGRKRRAGNHKSCPTEEELHHFREAIEISQRQKSEYAQYYAACGLSLQEYACHLRRSKAPEYRLIEEESLNMMRQAELLSDDLPSILIRIAKGLMPLRCETSVIKRCVLRCVELLPTSGLVNHVAGNFYMYRERDDAKAIHHLKIAALERGVFGAYINLIDLTWRTTSVSIDTLVMAFWEKYWNDVYSNTKALPAMAYYEFFVRNNLKKAISYWRKWMEVSAGKDFYENSLFVQSDDKDSNNLTTILLGEVQCVLEYDRTLSKDDTAYHRSFVETIQKAQPQLDIAGINVNRESFIRSALNDMDQKTRWVVEPKLPRSFLPNRLNIGFRQPSRRGANEQSQNWRER